MGHSRGHHPEPFSSTSIPLSHFSLVIRAKSYDQGYTLSSCVAVLLHKLVYARPRVDSFSSYNLYSSGAPIFSLNTFHTVHRPSIIISRFTEFLPSQVHDMRSVIPDTADALLHNMPADFP
jgi:hypothetical protein